MRRRTCRATAALGLGSGSAAAAYGESYVATRLLAQTYGQEALVAVYRRTEELLQTPGDADEGVGRAALDTALLEVTGLGIADLERSWRVELARLSAATP